MQFSIIVLFFALLSGCAIWKPGYDPRGVDVISKANLVLEALNKYSKQNGKPPKKLVDLVPNYLYELPSEPSMYYNSTDGSIFFTYSPTWPQQGNVSCSAKVGQNGVACIGYM